MQGEYQLTNQLAHELKIGRCDRPFSCLGTSEQNGKYIIRVWCNYATAVSLKSAHSQKSIVLLEEESPGVFSAVLDKAVTEEYSVCAATRDGEHVYIDPYQFQDFAYHAVHFIDHAPENLYHQAGAQLVNTESGIKGTRFCVFAPNAGSVYLIGDFNHWNNTAHPMQRTELGYWVLFMPNVEAGAQYKYCLSDREGNQLPDKSDPLGFSHHDHPSHASIVFDHSAYQWRDQKWREKRTQHNPYQSPMSIYEVHLGSWKRPLEGDSRYLTYHELAEDLVNYVTDMGYTHIEVLPVSEFPFDGSWGYQPVGLFAPTCRFGTPDEFKYFVDICHQNNIGVIIDWVPAHFPEDPHGLARFDGSCVYEYEDPRKGWHTDWNSCIYDFGKDTVRQFLVANALFWFDKFNVDGIRVDAVASMLYLDYSRNEGEWLPNVDGGNENYEAISLLQWMNTEVYAKHPHAITIAEESTSFAGVSKPVSSGGLGFGFKWNMGWMHDSLHYIAKDSAYRQYHHGELSFSMVYAYDENFVLPISHDEVVHGKGSMIQKMPGDDWQRFANLRTYYGFMFAHPGKKLQFMGNEFAPDKEWNHDESLPWHLLSYPSHQGIHKLYRKLNEVYSSEPALHELDHDPAGFRWVDLHNESQSIFAFARFAKHKNEVLLIVCNFTPIVHDEMRFGVPQKGQYSLLLNTDDACFGGSDFNTMNTVHSDTESWHGLENSILISVPPLATIIYKLVVQ
ncbi:1,4-alpha-glucan branching protein GlgB [Glaciecola petra]|uniref:1,4-alpha-glucan branching enzyme GlgB n=1 Tax=Glaciecola petra TaxID=3075602 RepID=A0ABU2ZNP2_9ALTE|nr:1,4-alpha-glucan branching protein GlgB [Aestuariibacter sp. P117]MDT0594036.1 1,4-alpha-glucan branching protein GlgB [Aestuariibacter sp. P117]